MRIKINDKDYVLPSSLGEMTLRQRIDFQLEHGNLLEAMEKSIMEMEDSEEKEMELAEFRLESIVRGISFFTGITIESLKESANLNQLVTLYLSSLAVIFKEEQEIKENIEYEHEWNGEIWKIHSPTLRHGDTLTFGEFIDSKQIIQNLINLGKNKWECLIPLCAIYLKREGEEYHESFLYEGSDRLKLMESLPLDIAFNVGFFLSSSLTLFTKTSQYFSNPELIRMENT